MAAGYLNEKTVVFAPRSLTRLAEPRSYNVDEPTRELPLIAGRFAGREWAVEDLQREETRRLELKKTAPRSAFRPRMAAAMALCVILALTLLVGSLLGRSRMVELNEEAVRVTAEISALEEEQRVLRVQYEELRRYPAAERLSAERITAALSDSRGQDKATVLHLRHDNEMPQLWRAFIDKLGESFR